MWLTDFNKQIPDVERSLGGGLQKNDVVFESVLLRLLGLNLPLALHIRLVASQRNHHIGVASALQLLHPRLGAVERILRADRVSEHSGERCSSAKGEKNYIPFSLYHTPLSLPPLLYST